MFCCLTASTALNLWLCTLLPASMYASDHLVVWMVLNLRFKPCGQDGGSRRAFRILQIMHLTCTSLPDINTNNLLKKEKEKMQVAHQTAVN